MTISHQLCHKIHMALHCNSILHWGSGSHLKWIISVSCFTHDKYAPSLYDFQMDHIYCVYHELTFQPKRDVIGTYLVSWLFPWHWQLQTDQTVPMWSQLFLCLPEVAWPEWTQPPASRSSSTLRTLIIHYPPTKYSTNKLLSTQYSGKLLIPSPLSFHVHMVCNTETDWHRATNVLICLYTLQIVASTENICFALSVRWLRFIKQYT